MAARGVVIEHPKPDRQFFGLGTVACSDCHWPEPRTWTRERTRQHVRDTGHTVRFAVVNFTVYRPAEGSP
jgi:hypothetical protein